MKGRKDVGAARWSGEAKAGTYAELVIYPTDRESAHDHQDGKQREHPAGDERFSAMLSPG
jgi:hypothetical protein